MFVFYTRICDGLNRVRVCISYKRLGQLGFYSFTWTHKVHFPENGVSSNSKKKIFIAHEIFHFFKKNTMTIVAPDIAAAHKIILLWKRTDFWHLVLLGEKVLFKESPPSIMVTRNPNWSTEILWYGIGYVKGKILSPLKRSA